MSFECPLRLWPGRPGRSGRAGPGGPAAGDLSLELGLSVWMHRSGTSLEDARSTLLALRAHVIEACGLDPATEPVPFVGRAPRFDVMTLIEYLGRFCAVARTPPASAPGAWPSGSWLSSRCPRQRPSAPEGRTRVRRPWRYSSQGEWIVVRCDDHLPRGCIGWAGRAPDRRRRRTHRDADPACVGRHDTYSRPAVMPNTARVSRGPSHVQPRSDETGRRCRR